MGMSEEKYTRIPMEDYTNEARQDRRINQVPVDIDRRTRVYEDPPLYRGTDGMPNYQPQDVTTRLAILEVKVIGNTDKLDNTFQTTNKLVERLDAHILQSTKRDEQLQGAVNAITTAVDTLTTSIGATNNTLVKIAETANSSHLQIVKWDAMVTTVFKVLGVLAVIVSAAWTLFTFVDKKMEAKAEVVAHVIQHEQPSHTLRDLEIAINDKETK